MDTLIQFGGSVKALGDGRVGGYLIDFTDADNPDLVRDFFTPDTDLDTEFPAKKSVFYNHGTDKTIGKRRLTMGEVKADDVGVWVEAQLDIADRYQAAIYKLAEAGKLGWSSGSVSHLIEREPVGKSFKLVSWPLAEASLTPNPCNPRSQAVALKSWEGETPSFKSLLQEIADAEADDIPEPIKAVYLGDDIETSIAISTVRQLNDSLMYNVLYAALSDFGLAAGRSVDEKIAMLGSAFDEFKTLSLKLVQMILSGLGDETAEDAAKAIRLSYCDPAKDTTLPRPVALMQGQELKQYLETMGTVVSDCERRLSWYDTERSVKAGRPISAANLEAMQAIHDGLLTHVGQLKSIIDRHSGDKPATVSASDVDSAFAQYMYLASRPLS